MPQEIKYSDQLQIGQSVFCLCLSVGSVSMESVADITDFLRSLIDKTKDSNHKQSDECYDLERDNHHLFNITELIL